MENSSNDAGIPLPNGHNTLGIMQPYFFPYIGYFSHILATDTFVLYDNIQYTKRGWINRNRIFSNGHVVPITIPLAKGRELLQICERRFASDFSGDKILRQLKGAYGQAPGWKALETLVGSVFQAGHCNLFDFLLESISMTCRLLEIDTRLIRSSTVAPAESLGGQNRVLHICKALSAEAYVNPIGGQHLYASEAFEEEGIDLKFISSDPRSIPRKEDALPKDLALGDLNRLSILDVIAWLGVEKTRICVREDFRVGFPASA
jgi:hypothetical protein